MATLKRLTVSIICSLILSLTSIQAIANINEIEIRVLPESIVYQEYYSDDEEIKEEFYVPAKYLRFAPGARKPSFLKNIDL